jgi:hypothetical protein
VERKYVMVKLSAGDWLLVSNDGLTIWRLYAYLEDGSLESYDGKPVKGRFWAAARRPLGAFDAEVAARGDYLAWDKWDTWAALLPTRAEAIAAALGAKPRRPGAV